MREEDSPQPPQAGQVIEGEVKPKE
jgi:hypothetical protein